MALITNLEEIHALATQRHDEFEIMRYMLEFLDDIEDAQLDAIVETIAAPIIAAIDCTQCANCCRSLDVYLTPDDAQTLSQGIHIPLEAISTQYLDHTLATVTGEWGKFKLKPCVFLRGNLCSVYDHRPDACRRYPQFTPDFRWTLADTIQGAALCPIIYNVLDALAAQVDNIVKKL